MSVRFRFAGRDVDAAEVRRWEVRRADDVLRGFRRRLDEDEVRALLRPLRLVADELPEVELRRRELALLREHVPAEERLEQVARPLRLSDRAARLAARASGGRRTAAVVEVVSDAGSAAGFVAWFRDRVAADDREVLTGGCPDHVALSLGDGGLEVVERVGSALLPSRVRLSVDDASGVRAPADDAYPHELVATARLADGTAVGGVRHQLREEGDGFSGTLRVELPVLTPPTWVAAHRWHLACEHLRWIEQAGEGQERRSASSTEP